MDVRFITVVLPLSEHTHPRNKRATISVPNAQPAPVHKPTQNQTSACHNESVEGITFLQLPALQDSLALSHQPQ